MDISNYLKQKWQDDHAEEYTKGLKDKNDFLGLVEALKKHPFEGVKRAALKTINQFDLTTLDVQIIDLLDQSLKRALPIGSEIHGSDFVDVANVLAKIKRPGGIGYLISFLDKQEYLHANLKVQWAFDECCSAIGDQGVDVILTHLLEHNDCNNEKMLVSGLGSIGGEAAYNALVLSLQHHCEKSRGNPVWNFLTVESYVYFLGKIGIGSNALEPLNASLELVNKSYLESKSGVLEARFTELIKNIKDLIKKIQTGTS
jgi:hypothetical protein